MVSSTCVPVVEGPKFECTGWVRINKLLILIQYVNKAEKIGWTWANTNSNKENEALPDIFQVKCFLCYTIILCLNSLWLKAVNEITARQTRTSLAKFIKVCSIEYLTTQIELVLPTFKSWTVHKIVEYLTSSLWNIYHNTTAYFFVCVQCNSTETCTGWCRKRWNMYMLH